MGRSPAPHQAHSEILHRWSTQGPARIRLSSVIGGLSYALDVTEGEPPGHAVRSCVIGMRIADELGLDAATRSHLFYALLMKDAGCTANAAKMAALFDADDHEAKRTAKRSNWSRAVPAFLWSLRTVAPRVRCAPAPTG